MQQTEHTFVHYYDLSSLYEQYYNLNSQYNAFRINTFKNNFYGRELGNYNNIIKFTQLSIKDKISHVDLHLANARNKRGLVNGLGTIFKTISGNLDHEDGKRYNNILKHLETNQDQFEKQLQMQYTVNKQVIREFNATVNDIKHNENLLKNKIFELGELVKNRSVSTDLITAKDLINQFIIIYNSILNVLQDIENSITFCKLRTLHPSIVKPETLFQELGKISKFYKGQFPFELKYENILDFETVLKINCKIENEKIIYFLSIPINFDKQFELYYLLPIPSMHEKEFVTVVPVIKYLLKSENDIIPLRDICPKSKSFQCLSQLQSSTQIKCEEQIVTKGNTDHCKYTKLNIEENHIELIPEINQYLAVFPKEEKLEIKCSKEAESKILRGVYLIKEDNCTLKFKNRELPYLQRSFGKPILNDKMELQFNKNQLPDLSIKLRTLNLKEISTNAIKLEEKPHNFIVPSVWTMALYFIIIIGVLFLLIKWKRTKFSKTKEEKHKSEDMELQEIPMKTVQSPGDVSI